MVKPTLSLPESKRRAERSGSRQSSSASTWLWFSGTTGMRGIFTGGRLQLREYKTVTYYEEKCDGLQEESLLCFLT